MSRVSLTAIEMLVLIAETIRQGNVTSGLSVLDAMIEEAKKPPVLDWGEDHPFTDTHPQPREQRPRQG